jgi:hypothetical protein
MIAAFEITVTVQDPQENAGNSEVMKETWLEPVKR